MAILRRNKTVDKPTSESARPPVTKRPATTGRATPKGTTSGRYTPPIPKEYRRSPTWVPVLMLTFLIVGMLTIISNYLPGAGFLPGDSNNWYLLLGLGLITLGFITATKYR
jgi:LPXTG-motif cell wall-anchored protein